MNKVFLLIFCLSLARHVKLPLVPAVHRTCIGMRKSESCWERTAIVKSPHVILKMAGMSNCLVDLTTTRSAARKRNVFLWLLEELLFWALHIMFSLHVSQSIPEDDNHTVVNKMITSFSGFQQPPQYIIHFPIQGLIYATLSMVSQFASSNFLVFLPQLC